MLILPKAVYAQIRTHGEQAYPHECCGILTGSADKTVAAAILCANVSTHPWNHYEIAPLDLIRAQRDARSSGLEIIGFYHSHPDHPAHWSATDLAEAHWIGCVYMIVSVEHGKAASTQAFRLGGATEDDKHFAPEDIRINT